MRKNELKLAAVQALGSQSDFFGLRLLDSCSARDGARFLRWLDHSGLGLHFYSRIRDAGKLPSLPPDLARALAGRAEANRTRTNELFDDFRAVSAALTNLDVPHAFLKGFTLTPEFCPDAALRHQSDLDILVDAESIALASEALKHCGYKSAPGDEPGEFRFTTPLTRVSTLHDDIYQPPPQREVEVHTRLWKDAGDVRLPVPQDCLAHARGRELDGVRFTALSLEDAFLMQLLHSFGHLLGSWLRLAWLWEIHYFVERHAHDELFWNSFRARAGQDPALSKAMGLVLGLTAKLFDTRVPLSITRWYVDPMPSRLHAWIDHCGTEWALADISGSKLSLLIHGEFFDDPAAWRRYLWRRIVPLSAKTSHQLVEASDWKTRLRGRANQIAFISRRLIFHAGAGVSLAWQAARRRSALNSSRKQRAASF